MNAKRPFFTILCVLFFSGALSTKFTFINNCPYTIWPATLTGSGGAQLPSTGFELASKLSSSLDIPAPWTGRFWARTFCSCNGGRFLCAAADCGTGQIHCNGAGGTPPASLVEFTLATNGGQDFYDVSLVDGFNLPVSIVPTGGSGNCNSTSCPVDVNANCPAELAVKGPDGAVIGCKSACGAFNTPQYCCSGDFNRPETCPPTSYSKFFKSKCPQAYSYAYDDQTSTFTCSNAASYQIIFCP